MPDATDRLFVLLTQLYGPTTAADLLPQVMARLESFPRRPQTTAAYALSERDITLITYGDTLNHEAEPPLQTLNHFAQSHLSSSVSAIHILPFYPYSSDDGFSVIDYYAVRPDLGDWDDLVALHQHFRLMFDAVINHMSAHSEWFQAFLKRKRGYSRLFATALPQDNLATVTRPRTSPLLTPFEAADGETLHVWTTFSADQVDLNYRAPETLLRILDVLLFYIERGADIIRLDAIGFLWKEPGTTSIHLPQTHAAVQFYRAALDVVAPDVILITETNVPHAENIAYFGDGTNEAQLVYNFTLPPLLLHTLLSADCRKLAAWVNTLKAPSPQTTFFNFTASHDGIGVRPVEGILDADELARLVAHTEAVGGRVSYKPNLDGSRSPYELNVTYVDAMAGLDAPVETQVQRFLVSQAVMLSLAGMPAVYIHSLLGSRNDQAGVARTGQNRSINRAKLDASAVAAELADPNSFRARVFSRYRHMLEVRRNTPAFHPNAAQFAEALNQGAVLAITRTPPGSAPVLGLFNVSGDAQEVALPGAAYIDSLTRSRVLGSAAQVPPYGILWLVEADSPHAKDTAPTPEG